jgi:hypothetical protein
MKRTLIVVLSAIAILLGAGVITAQTRDAETPANEGVCDDLVYATPGLYGLCVAFCEAQDCEPDFTVADPFENCTPSSPKLLDIYNRKKTVTDPEMPCVQPTACPCWTPGELIDWTIAAGTIPDADSRFCSNAPIDLWSVVRFSPLAIVVLIAGAPAMGDTYTCFASTANPDFVMTRSLVITGNEYVACQADVISSGQALGFDCWD